MRKPRRNIPTWSALIAFVVALGIGSRRFTHALPSFLAAYAGDNLWALAAFLLVGLAMPTAPTRRVAALAMSISLLVEISQLYHAPWID